MRAAVVLQARVGSRRLPGKVLRLLDGQAVVVHCIRRLRTAGLGRIILAAPGTPENDELCAVASRAGADVARGPERDVLGRVWAAARDADAQAVVRATADNPAVDPDAVRRVLDAVRAGADHAVDQGLPVGATVEGVARGALDLAHREAAAEEDREHVTPFIRRQGHRFRTVTLLAPQPYHRPDLRFTVDTSEDLRYMNDLLSATAAARRIVPLDELIVAADQLASVRPARRTEVA